MKRWLFLRIMLGLMVLGMPVGSLHAQATKSDPLPALMLWKPDLAQQVRQMALAGNERVASAVRDLCQEADKQLLVGPFSVVDKTFLPPSGDKHDFSTIGRYWWPNPDTPDGLPWIRKDGETNPDYFDGSLGDTQRFSNMRSATVTLARAYYMTGKESYATKAAQLLRVWFINEQTRMNPHAKYAARFPGHWEGKSWGIHSTCRLTQVCDAVGLIQQSASWTQADQKAMHDWMAAYLDWLLTSPNGIEEGNQPNNHATAFDWLLVRLAVFVGKTDLAKDILEQFKTRRIDTQIKPDGSMPHELARANGWRYEGYALEFLFRVAMFGDQLGVDLWHYQAPNGASLHKALDFIVRHIQPQPGQIDQKKLKSVMVSRIGPLLAIGAAVYNDPNYDALNHAIGFDDQLRIHYSAPNPHLNMPGLLEP
ncbi:MAG: alginate lyase family protein [Phycisphaeraceae bacterium JB051]